MEQPTKEELAAYVALGDRQLNAVAGPGCGFNPRIAPHEFMRAAAQWWAGVKTKARHALLGVADG